MCESNAYYVDNAGNQDLIMESVTYVKTEGSKLVLRSLFGEEKVLDAAIVELNLTGHRIVLART
jgi:predicted RNA-binding protein